MDYAALTSELTNDPESIGYAGLDDMAIADLLNAPRVSVPQEFYLNARRLYAVCGQASAKALLTAVKAQDEHLYAMIMQVGDTSGLSGGVDVSLPETQGTLEVFVGAGLITAEHAATLKALGSRLASRAEVLGLGSVHHSDVARALRGEQASAVTQPEVPQ